MARLTCWFATLALSAVAFVQPVPAQPSPTQLAATTPGLPADFAGKLLYFGNHSGEIVETRQIASRNKVKCPKPGGGCPDRIGGSLQVELSFDGDIVKGRYRGTGGLRPANLIGRREGASCRLFDTSDGAVWTGRCDARGFTGGVKSVPNAGEQIGLSFETVAVRVIDFVEYDRMRELADRFPVLAPRAFGDADIGDRLDALLQIESLRTGTPYRAGSLGKVRKSDSANRGRDYVAYAEYATGTGRTGWIRARMLNDGFACIELWDRPGVCEPVDRSAPEAEPVDDWGNLLSPGGYTSPGG